MVRLATEVLYCLGNVSMGCECQEKVFGPKSLASHFSTSKRWFFSPSLDRKKKKEIFKFAFISRLNLTQNYFKRSLNRFKIFFHYAVVQDRLGYLTAKFALYYSDKWYILMENWAYNLTDKYSHSTMISIIR